MDNLWKCTTILLFILLSTSHVLHLITTILSTFILNSHILSPPTPIVFTLAGSKSKTQMFVRPERTPCTRLQESKVKKSTKNQKPSLNQDAQDDHAGYHDNDYTTIL
jgi:hypothetical protein